MPSALAPLPFALPRPAAAPHGAARGPAAGAAPARPPALARAGAGLPCAAVLTAAALARRPGGRPFRAAAAARGAAVSAAALDEKPPFVPAEQLGAVAPLGFFDPVGFCREDDREGFRYYRAAELKHGRVAMLAAVGAVAQHFVRFPGYEGVPDGLAAVGQAPASYGLGAVVVLAGFLDFFVWTQDPAEEPGDFGDPLGFGMYDSDMRNREISNGRMAMVSVAGIAAAELATGSSPLQQLELLRLAAAGGPPATP